jgi:hypothetical protein
VRRRGPARPGGTWPGRRGSSALALLFGDAGPALRGLFEQYSNVALSEGPHNNQKGHEFRLALARDPRFGRLVDGVVVEFSNARYQSVMDRFTSARTCDCG